MALAAPNDRDPRIADGPGGEASVRPLVVADSRPLPWWIFALGAAVAALLLFVVLDSHRRSAYAPPVKPRLDDAQGAPVAPPALFIPAPPAPPPTPVAIVMPPPAPIPMAPQPPRIIYVPQPAPPMQGPPPQPPRAASDPALVLDTTVGDAAGPAAPGAADGGGAVSAVAARATMMRNRATTVAQGTLIVREALQEFHALLAALAAEPANRFTLVETQGLLAARDWANELHPYPAGFRRVAEKFLEALRRAFPSRI